MSGTTQAIVASGGLERARSDLACAGRRRIGDPFPVSDDIAGEPPPLITMTLA